MNQEGITIKVTADLSGAFHKTQTINRIPKAFHRNINQWASETVRYIKQSYKGGKVFARPPKEIDQRLGYKVLGINSNTEEVIIGTGREIGRDEVVYAKIQEEGGWIAAKKSKWLTIPFTGVKGTAANYRQNSFIFKSKKTGKLYIGMKSGKRGKLKGLFSLRLRVKLPPRFWFSKPIAERQPELRRLISEEEVWITAQKLASKGR